MRLGHPTDFVLCHVGLSCDACPRRFTDTNRAVGCTCTIMGELTWKRMIVSRTSFIMHRTDSSCLLPLFDAVSLNSK